MVKIDWYTRTLLTIIAASLVWLCFSSGFVSTVVEAQSAPQKIVVVGWSDENGYVHLFPSRKIGGSSTAPAALPVHDAR